MCKILCCDCVTNFTFYLIISRYFYPKPRIGKTATDYLHTVDDESHAVKECKKIGTIFLGTSKSGEKAIFYLFLSKSFPVS